MTTISLRLALLIQVTVLSVAVLPLPVRQEVLGNTHVARHYGWHHGIGNHDHDQKRIVFLFYQYGTPRGPTIAILAAY